MRTWKAGLRAAAPPPVNTMSSVDSPGCRRRCSVSSACSAGALLSVKPPPFSSWGRRVAAPSPAPNASTQSPSRIHLWR